MLRRARAEIRDLKDMLARSRARAEGLSVRAVAAEKECAEWKQRFDTLLRRDSPAAPEITGPGPAARAR